MYEKDGFAKVCKEKNIAMAIINIQIYHRNTFYVSKIVLLAIEIINYIECLSVDSML